MGENEDSPSHRTTIFSFERWKIREGGSAKMDGYSGENEWIESREPA